MKQTLKYGLPVLLFLLTTFTTAQHDSGVIRDFNNLENYLRQVWEVVKVSHVDRAKGLMAEARDEFEIAREFLFQSNPPQIMKARIHMAKARHFANLAAKLVLREPLGKLKAQLDELINRAERIVGDSHNDEAIYLLQKAKKFQRKAYEAFTSDNPRMNRGQEYFRIAFFFGQKAIDVARGKAGNMDDRVEDFKTNLDQLFTQASQLVNASGDETLIKLFDEARKQMVRAEQMMEHGKKDQALKRFRIIEKLMYRIIDQSDRGKRSNSEKYENNMYSLRALLQAIENDLTTERNEKLQKMLQKAWQFYREAEQAFENGQRKRGETKMSLSQRMANRLLKQMKKQDEPVSSDMQQQIDETRRVLELQKSNARSADASSLLKQAETLLDRAQANVNSGNDRAVWQLLDAATRMATRVQQLDKQDQTRTSDQLRLESELQRLNTILNKIEQNADLKANHPQVIEQWRYMYRTAQSAIMNGQPVIADEYLQTAFQQIMQYTKKWK